MHLSLADILMKEFGYERVRFKRGEAKPTYSQAYERYGNCLVRARSHLAAIKDGALQDTWDGRFYEYPKHKTFKLTPRGFKGAPDWAGEWETRQRKAISVFVRVDPLQMPKPISDGRCREISRMRKEYMDRIQAFLFSPMRRPEPFTQEQLELPLFDEAKSEKESRSLTTEELLDMHFSVPVNILD